MLSCSPATSTTGPRCEQAHHVGHLRVLEQPRYVVVRAVVDGHHGIAERAEVTRGHRVPEPRQHRRGEEARGAATGVAHNADPRPVHVVAGLQIIEAAVNVEHPLAEQRAAEHQRVHGGVVTAMGRDALLVPLAALAERPLLDAERGDSARHAAQPEVTITLDRDGHAVIVAVNGDGNMRPGRVALDADEPGVGRCRRPWAGRHTPSRPHTARPERRSSR